MSQRFARKVRQYYRRDIRLQKSLQLKILNECLKTKPKYVPKKLWDWGIRIFFDVEKFGKKVFGNKTILK